MAQTKWQKEHRKEINAWRRKWNLKNPERQRAAYRRDYERHRETYRKRSKRNYEKHKSDPEFKQKRLIRQRKWYETNRAERTEKAYRYRLRIHYGLSWERYTAMLAAQSGGCAICGTKNFGPHKRLAVDHCHRTGQIRGLLCHRCNLLLGKLESVGDWIQKAAAYLQKA